MMKCSSCRRAGARFSLGCCLRQSLDRGGRRRTMKKHLSMKPKTSSVVASLAGALILSGTASASYLGLSVVKVNSLTVGGGPKDVYRVYANFSDANDYFV